ncbi:ADP-ribose 1''-phosphate phosphatase [Alternaria rosae]|nr:ADP-ribose 1''-phosphate phosphatase [Alternaria rosae]
MPPKDSTITSYFGPKPEFRPPTKTNRATERTTKKATMTPSSEPEDKGKRKRALSGSPAPIPEKRQHTKPSAKPTTPRHLSHKDLPSNKFSQSPSSSDLPTLSLTYHIGDIFDAPPQTLLVHACNTQGVWGSGIAKAFKDDYPKAHTIYRDFCTKEHLLKSRPVPTGIALLIPPVDGEKQHWIGCLFTSSKYGKAKDKSDVIVENTKPAMEMLFELVKMADGIEVIRMCKINSGKFGVKWERTEDVLEGIVVREGWMESVEVWEPEMG